MELISILHRCHHFRGFVYQNARFSSDHKNIEIDIRPHKGSTAVCSRCHQPAPGYDQLAESFIKMAADYRLNDPANDPILPEAWTARYEIMLMKESTFRMGVAKLHSGSNLWMEYPFLSKEQIERRLAPPPKLVFGRGQCWSAY